MKIGLPGFQPANLFNKFINTQEKPSGDIGLPKQGYQTDLKGIAAKVMGNKLADTLSMPESKKNGPDSLFDFEEVAKNVLGFVKGAVLKAQGEGADHDKLESMLDQARKGIAIGIEEAEKELEESGLLTEEVSEGIAKSEELMSKGLDDLSDSLFSAATPSNEIFSNYRQASQYSLSNGAQLSIKTLDGDEINITFNSDFSQSKAMAFQSNDQEARFSSQSSASFSYGFSLEVNGELDEQEQEAINALMADLQGVSDAFFDGDIDEAFDKALDLNMDTSQLAAFSMNLQQTESMSSVKQYQRNIPGQDLAEQLKPINEGLGRAREQAKPLNIESELVSLLEWLNKDKEQVDKLLEYSRTVFEQYSLLETQKTNKADKEINRTF